MHSVLFYLPTRWIGLSHDVPVFGFGLLVVLAFAVAVWISRRRAVRLGLDREKIVDLCLYATVAGIVGARLTFLVFDWRPDSSSDHWLLDMIAIWKGGLTYQGGLVAGILVVWWTMHTRYLPAGRYLDALAPGVLVGAGIGRIGCYLNGCCWGRIAEAGTWWAVRFPERSPVHGYHAMLREADPAGWAERAERLGHTLAEAARLPLPVWPTQLFETAGYFAIALLLLGVERAWRDRRPGALMMLAVAFYSIFRFFIEFYRDDTALISPVSLVLGPPPPGAPPPLFALHFGQWVAILMVAAVVAVWLITDRRAARAEDGDAGGAPDGAERKTDADASPPDPPAAPPA